jgi:hypothetical protein
VAPLSHQLDRAASSHTAETILKGTYDAADLDNLTQAVLNECKYKTDPHAITDQISTEAFIGKFRSWNESTSMLPSGRHLGMYKALIACHSASNKDVKKDVASLQASLIQVHVTLINYCLKFRYSLCRWKEIVNVMILKKRPAKTSSTASE